MPCAELGARERAALLSIARASIAHGLEHGDPLEAAYLEQAGLISDALAAPAATFVTIKKHGDLRGCVGSLEVKFPLAVDVARNGYLAAFHDSRFAQLHAGELQHIHLEITVLSPHEPINVASEAQLLAELEPGRDGLVLECEGRRATFLPQVWEHLPDPSAFVAELKLKAGIPTRYWSHSVRAYRYRAESFAETARA